MNALGLLLRLRARLFANRLARGPRGPLRVAGAVLIACLTGGFVFAAGMNASLLVERVDRADPVAAAQALPVLLVAITLLTLVTSLSSAFHHLLLAADLELLLVSPAQTSSLIWLKILEIWRDCLHILLFQGAALIGYGQTLHLPLTYYPLALLVGAALTIAACALGAIGTLLLARVRFGQPLLDLSRVVAVLIFLPLGLLGVPALGLGRNRLTLLLDQRAADNVAGSLNSFGPPPTWAPTTWAAHLLLGDDAAGLSLALLVVTGVVLYLAVRLAWDALYQPAWERVRFAGAHPRRAAVSEQRRRAAGAPSGPIVGLLQKDWRTLLRDPRWRTGAVVSVVALGLPAMVLFGSDPFARSVHALRFWLGMIPVPYLAYLFGSQHGASTLAYEGRNIALLRAAPVGMPRILLAKVLGGLLLVLVITWTATLALALSHAGQPVEVGAALLGATWLALGGTSAAVAGAALTTDFEGDNPARRIGCLGNLLTGSLSLFFFVTNTALLVWWVIRTSLTVPRPVLPFAPILDWGLPIVALLAVAAIGLTAGQGLRRLSQWEIS